MRTGEEEEREKEGLRDGGRTGPLLAMCVWLLARMVGSWLGGEEGDARQSSVDCACSSMYGKV